MKKYVYAYFLTSRGINEAVWSSRPATLYFNKNFKVLTEVHLDVCGDEGSPYRANELAEDGYEAQQRVVDLHPFAQHRYRKHGT